MHMSNTGAAPLELTVSTTGWLGRQKKPEPAEVIKFNRFHMTFNGKRQMKPGQLIQVNLAAGSHAIKEVSARVETCEPCGPHYQCVVRFVLERPDKKPYREAISILKSIEQAVPSNLIAPLHMQIHS
jgi:hypothetical protein